MIKKGLISFTILIAAALYLREIATLQGAVPPFDTICYSFRLISIMEYRDIRFWCGGHLYPLALFLMLSVTDKIELTVSDK